MTIAVGVLATDGVVLAADTQLTIPQIWKGEFGKFTAAHKSSTDASSGACAITGATTVYECLHRLGDDLRHDFVDNLYSADKAAAFQRFGSVIRRFHNRYVFPVAHNPPEVNVLIGYQRDGVLALWQSNGNMLVEQPHFGAVGAGAHAASAWLNRVWKLSLDVPKAVVIAALATALAKDSVDGCGKRTHVVAVEGDDYRFIEQSLINEIDALYDVMALEVQPAQILSYFGEEPRFRPSMSAEDFKQRIARVTESIRDATPSSVKQWRSERWDRLKAAIQDRRSPKDDSSGQPPLQESRGASDES